MIRASIAYSNPGHTRVMELCTTHRLSIIELFEAMAFADDAVVKTAIEQGLPRRKEKMFDSKKMVSQAKRAIKTMTSDQLALIIQSQPIKA